MASLHITSFISARIISYHLDLLSRNALHSFAHSLCSSLDFMVGLIFSLRFRSLLLSLAFFHYILTLKASIVSYSAFVISFRFAFYPSIYPVYLSSIHSFLMHSTALSVLREPFAAQMHSLCCALHCLAVVSFACFCQRRCCRCGWRVVLTLILMRLWMQFALAYAAAELLFTKFPFRCRCFVVSLFCS